MSGDLPKLTPAELEELRHQLYQLNKWQWITYEQFIYLTDKIRADVAHLKGDKRMTVERIVELRSKVAQFDRTGFLVMSLEEGVEVMRELIRMHDDKTNDALARSTTTTNTRATDTKILIATESATADGIRESEGEG